MSTTIMQATFTELTANSKSNVPGSTYVTTVNAQVEEDARTYTLPDLLKYWPYKYAINPYYRSAQSEAEAWLESFRPFTPAAQEVFNKCHLSLFTSLVYPQASHHALRSCCDLMNTFFILDDCTDTLDAEETRFHCEASMDAVLNLDKARPEGEPIIGEISRQFWKRASATLPQAVRERFLQSWQEYVDAVIVQAQRRDQSHYFCTMEEYMVARRDNIGCAPAFAFVEIEFGLDIPRGVMEHSIIVQLNQDATDMIILANDMYSYKKEIEAGDADYNAITVLITNYDRDVAGAIEWIADTHRGRSARFLQAREDVLRKRGFPSFGEELDRQIMKYIDGVGQFIRGENDWTYASGRYFGNDGKEVEKTRKVTIVHPSRRGAN